MEILTHILRGVLGIVILLGLAVLLSSDRKSIRWRIVIVGIALQLFIAALALKVNGTSDLMSWFSQQFVALLGFADEGVKLLFGNLALLVPEQGVVGLQVAAVIIFFSALTALLYYLRILQWIVFGLAWVMHRLMGLSGPECLAAAANVFVGMTEAPLVVKPYLNSMTRSEIMALMTGGMATIAGSVLGAYVFFIGGPDPAMQAEVARVLITASFMSAPAALVMAKIFVPETEEVSQDLIVPRNQIGDNAFDAIARGAGDGLKLALNVLAMLIAFLGLLHLGNWILEGIGSKTGLNHVVSWASGGHYEKLSLQVIAGPVFAVAAFIIGVGSPDLLVAGEMLGTKFFFNEFIAFAQLGELNAAGKLDPKTVFLLSFALCGFSNFGSIGIQIGGIGALAPEIRPILAKLAFRAMIAGTLASLATAAAAGMFYS